MPLKIKLVVGSDTFEVEGDAMDPGIVDLAKAWVGALPPTNPDDAETAEQIRLLGADVGSHRQALSTAAEQATPPEPAPPA